MFFLLNICIFSDRKQIHVYNEKVVLPYSTDWDENVT